MKLKDLFPMAKPGGTVLALGELLLDFVPGFPGMQLCQTGPVVKTVSGSSGIFACAAASLGSDTQMLCRLGDDAFSTMTREAIRAYGVKDDYVITESGGKLGLAFVEYSPTGRNYIYYRDSSVGSRLAAEDIPEEAFAEARILHFPGMLLELNPKMRSACIRAAELAKQHNVLFSFDPNLRKEINADKEAKERLYRMISLADIIEPTLEEARQITGKQEIADIIAALHAMGPRFVAITMDKDGALFSVDGQVIRAEGIDASVVDPTGAGDTFAGALAYCLGTDMEMEQALVFCNSAATYACTVQGAIGTAIPNLADVRAFMTAHPCKIHA